MSDKNRDISIVEFLDALQKEYLVAEMRYKIYPKISDRKFWKKVMDGKKEKVEDICFRNKIESIFTSKEEFERLYQQVYNEYGLPNFTYRDDVQRHGVNGYPGLEESDINNFYASGSPVFLRSGDRASILGWADAHNLIVELDVEEDVRKQVHMNDIKRPL